MKKSFYLAGILLLFFSQLSFSQSIKYVNVNVSGGANNGINWNNAYTDLQVAINDAVAGDTVWVVMGYYGASDPSGSFVMKNGIVLLGGFIGTETNSSQRDSSGNGTVLEPGSLTSVIVYNNIDSTTVLDGFSIQSGFTSAGGGIYNLLSAPVIKNCSFINNYALGDNILNSGQGGAIYNLSSSPTIINCVFENNTASDNGTDGSISQGGAIFDSLSHPVIINCIFNNNSAIAYNNSNGNSYGGAIYNGASSPKIVNCVFVLNFSYGAALSYGGAIYNNASSPVITNCTFDNNYADGLIPAGYCGGIYNANASASIITNCIFQNNLSHYNTGSVLPDIYDDASVSAVTYSLTQSTIAGAGNTQSTNSSCGSGVFINESNPIGGDNVWMTADDGLIPNYSSILNTGTPDTTGLGLPAKDIIGSSRIGGNRIDMGAYEKPLPNITPGQKRIYVNANNSSGSYDGSSWSTATHDLQAAIYSASAGDTLWVAQGTYLPLSCSFNMKDSVVLLGGFAGTEVNDSERNWVTNITTLYGNGSNVIYNNTIDSTAVLEGFTITNGYGDYGGGMYNHLATPVIRNCTFANNYASNNGGGMYNDSSMPAIQNCTFMNNSAGNNGGGMYNDSSMLNIQNCTFMNNGAGNNGGGMYNDSSMLNIQNCTFLSNGAVDGGNIYNDLSSPLIMNCTFQQGNAIAGGSMYNNLSSPVITNTLFYYNTINGNGGAMYNNTSSPVITNSVFDYNSINGNGGAMYNNSSAPIITNSVFDYNSINGNGGAMYNTASSPLITNCTFNTSTGYAGGALKNDNASLPVLTNCVLWNNGDEINNDGSSTAQFNYCYTQTPVSGTGNITGTVSPFVNDGGGSGNDGIWMTSDDDLRLSACAVAAINGGKPDTSGLGIPPVDITGGPRIIGPQIDMGAYEFSQSKLSVATAPGTYQSGATVQQDSITYFCDCANNILLGLDTTNTGAVIPADGVSVSINDGATYYPNGTGFVNNTDGTVLFNRQWAINATTEPVTPVTVYNYYTTDEYNNVNDTLIAHGLNPLNAETQMYWYKVTNSTLGEFPAIADVSTADVQLIYNGTTPGINRWVAETLDGNKYAVFKVNSFSGGGGGGNSNNVLPVHLISFTGKQYATYNLLNWNITPNATTSYFEIQRSSSNNDNFITIGNQKVNSIIQTGYSFYDNQPLDGAAYYRLRIVDESGTVTYSNIVYINTEAINSCTVFPNPAKDVVNITVNNNKLIGSAATVYDANGKALQTVILRNQTLLLVKQYAAGTYLLRLANGETYKIIISN